MSDKTKTAVVFMADGMELCECLLTVDILRRAKVNVITASIMQHKRIDSSQQVTLYADAMACDVDYDAADIVIMPGGRTGTMNLAGCDLVAEKCKAFAADPEKYVAAICAAPSVLAGLGLLDGKKATCHPDFEDKMHLANLTHESVTVDGNIITGQALGATMDFALCIAGKLTDKDTVDKVVGSICYKHW